jgi:protein-disulfide isomerase/integrase
VGVQYDSKRDRFVVRWQEDGKKRCRRFRTDEEAEAFDETLARHRGRPSEPAVAIVGRPPESQRGDGVYAYETKQGRRWRFTFRHADGSISSRRGFTSRQAAVTAKRRLLEAIDRHEVKPARETFSTVWAKLLNEKRAYMTGGSLQDFETHGRKRLLPFFADDRLARIDEERVREWLADMVELVEAGDLAPKTVNNARTWLSVALNVAVSRHLIARNPCDVVPPLPLEQQEIDYLRIAEIEPYLDACADFYRALAQMLIATGARVSEAITIRWPDLDLERGIVRVYRQRSRENASTRPTKGKRFRPVQIGPRLCETLRAVPGARREERIEDRGWVFLCPQPTRGRYARRSEPVPPHRKTVLGGAAPLVDLAYDVDPTRDHIRGPLDAPVTVVEYGDFECPYCGRAEPQVRELLRDFSDARYIWRHLPLSAVHLHAEQAAEAAEAAAAQDAFWPMHDLLLAHQEALETSDLLGYAGRLGLDVERFAGDLEACFRAKRIAADVESADLSGVTGTPTFFINGRRHYGPYDIASLSAAVRAAETHGHLRS